MVALIVRHLLDRRSIAGRSTRHMPRPRRRRPAGSFLQRAGSTTDDEFALGRLREAIAAVRLHRDRVRVRAGRCGLQLRADARSRRADPDRRLRRRHERFLHSAGRPDTTAPRADARRHHRHRRRRGRRRCVRQADHPQARRAAARPGVGIFLAAGQVPADSELAVRTARTVASSLVPQHGEESGDARAPAAHRAHSRAARGVRTPYQERDGISAARGRPPDEVRAFGRRPKRCSSFSCEPVSITRK